jgi:hypothetical protein
LDDNFWLTQKAIAQLFGVQVPAISKNLKNIYLSEELDEKAVVSKMEKLDQTVNSILLYPTI